MKEKWKIPIFIGTYRNIKYFSSWWSIAQASLENVDYKLIIADNGKQDLRALPTGSEWIAFQTTNNIGCAGLWNLCADIGFDALGFEKIIIGQEDAEFDGKMIKDVFKFTNKSTICGAYADGFTFSLFGLHKNVWETIGRFDENLIFVSHEDCDYTQRCYRANIGVKSLNYNRSLNKNLESQSAQGKIASVLNKAYMDEKWGENWNNPYPKDMGFHEHFVKVYGKRDKFPSESEYEWIKKAMENV